MKKLPRSLVIPAVLGILLLLAGDLYNSFGFLVCVLGCVSLLVAWLAGLRCFSRHESAKVRKITKIVKIITFTAFSVFLASFFLVEGLILANDDGTEAPTAQTLIVLGAGLDGDKPSATLLERLKTTLAYLEDNPEACAIVTGGQGPHETCTEASAMARWLTARGIDESRIYLEEQAHDTVQNLAFSKAILEENDLPGPVALVSNSFHLYRARILAQNAGYGEVQTLSAPVPPVPLGWLTASVYLREYCSIILMALRAVL